MVTYEPNPRYAADGGSVSRGWGLALDSDVLPAGADAPAMTRSVSVDGPVCAEWGRVIEGIAAVLQERALSAVFVDVRTMFKPEAEVVALTSTPQLADDPDFLKLADLTMADLMDLPAEPGAEPGLVIRYGPGASLLPHDVLWYVDLPKRYAEAAVTGGTGTNLGCEPGKGTTKRLFYVDWPLLDRHRDSIIHDIDRFFDVQLIADAPAASGAEPASLSGASLRRTIDVLVTQPFRTRPTFNTTSWGGTWAQNRIGMNTGARNSALGYELIAPESGVLIGASASAQIEVPFQLIVALHPNRMLGPEVAERFGTSFPVRFDYLDTFEGGNLSVHLHPRADYMREVFGWPYTQHETYYLMVGGEQNKVFLGLREKASIRKFHKAAEKAHEKGKEFDIEKFVQTFPATPHQLFVIPAGTPHGSGVGNVVLEVSATPYLYSLRFYDWLRRDADGNQRAVHVEHAFKNLNEERTGAEVRADLVQEPAVIASGEGWSEEVIGTLPEMFFDVLRIVLDSGGEYRGDTKDRFHVLNVVQGEGVLLTAASGFRQRFAYAETFVIPAAVGPYVLSRLGDERVRLVKAQVS